MKKNQKIFYCRFSICIPPYQLFFRKISDRLLSPYMEHQYTPYTRGDTGGVYLNILVLNINDLQEY